MLLSAPAALLKAGGAEISALKSEMTFRGGELLPIKSQPELTAFTVPYITSCTCGGLVAPSGLGVWKEKGVGRLAAVLTPAEGTPSTGCCSSNPAETGTDTPTPPFQQNPCFVGFA